MITSIFFVKVCYNIAIQMAGTLTLWKFLHQLLTSNKCPDVIQWIDSDVGEFIIKDPDKLAQMWGEVKQKSAMTYAKLSRGLRYYYDKGIMTKIAGKRYGYRFTEASRIVNYFQKSPGFPDGLMKGRPFHCLPSLNCTERIPVLPYGSSFLLSKKVSSHCDTRYSSSLRARYNSLSYDSSEKYYVHNFSQSLGRVNGCPTRYFSNRGSCWCEHCQSLCKICSRNRKHCLPMKRHTIIMDHADDHIYHWQDFNNNPVSSDDADQGMSVLGYRHRNSVSPFETAVEEKKQTKDSALHSKNHSVNWKVISPKRAWLNKVHVVSKPPPLIPLDQLQF